MKLLSKYAVICTSLLMALYGGFLISMNHLKDFGYYPLVVESGSMEPEISTGSLIIADAKQEQTTIGDIVVFFVGEGQDQFLVTHRIVDETSTGYVTKGDANEKVDLMELKKDRILGKVTMIIPKLGFLVSEMDQKANIRIAMYLMFLWGMAVLGNQKWR